MDKVKHVLAVKTGKKVARAAPDAAAPVASAPVAATSVSSAPASVASNAAAPADAAPGGKGQFTKNTPEQEHLLFGITQGILKSILGTDLGLGVFDITHRGQGQVQPQTIVVNGGGYPQGGIQYGGDPSYTNVAPPAGGSWSTGGGSWSTDGGAPTSWSTDGSVTGSVPQGFQAGGSVGGAGGSISVDGGAGGYSGDFSGNIPLYSDGSVSYQK